MDRERELELEMDVLRTNVSFAEEQLEKAEAENTELRQELFERETRIDELETKVADLEQELVEVQGVRYPGGDTLVEALEDLLKDIASGAEIEGIEYRIADMIDARSLLAARRY